MDKNRLYSIARTVFSASNVNNQWFAIVDTPKTIAGAWGGYTDVEFPIIGIMGASVVGYIYVNPEYLQSFTDAEWSFIIAHECYHIIGNHVLGSTFLKVTERVLRGQNDENKVIVGAIKLLLARFSPQHLPPDAILLRDQEYDADEMAVQFTRDLHTAINFLNRIARGNLGIASHMWDLIGVELPAMTIEQRIKELIRRSTVNGIT